MSSTEINKSTVKHSGNQYKEAKTTQFRNTSFDIQNVFEQCLYYYSYADKL